MLRCAVILSFWFHCSLSLLRLPSLCSCVLIHMTDTPPPLPLRTCVPYTLQFPGNAKLFSAQCLPSACPGGELLLVQNAQDEWHHLHAIFPASHSEQRSPPVGSCTLCLHLCQRVLCPVSIVCVFLSCRRSQTVGQQSICGFLVPRPWWSLRKSC